MAAKKRSSRSAKSTRAKKEANSSRGGRPVAKPKARSAVGLAPQAARLQAELRESIARDISDRLRTHQREVVRLRAAMAARPRCAVLHAFGTEVDFHKQNPDAKKFGYPDGGKHAYDPAIDKHLVIIGTASFLNDIVTAVGDFVEDWKNDLDLRARVASRLPRVLETFPAPVNG
jgi:hypothetical protein